jgi:hypothetical protein
MAFKILLFALRSLVRSPGLVGGNDGGGDFATLGGDVVAVGAGGLLNEAMASQDSEKVSDAGAAMVAPERQSPLEGRRGTEKGRQKIWLASEYVDKQVTKNLEIKRTDGAGFGTRHEYDAAYRLLNVYRSVYGRGQAHKTSFAIP